GQRTGAVDWRDDEQGGRSGGDGALGPSPPDAKPADGGGAASRDRQGLRGSPRNRSPEPRRDAVRRPGPAAMIVVDTSALIAILNRDPDARVYAEAIAEADPPLLSTAT